MYNDDNLFPLFHAYNKLVRRGLVKPLTCDCGQELTMGVDKKVMTGDDQLILECYTCGTIVRPGTTTISDVYAVVTEHFMEH